VQPYTRTSWQKYLLAELASVPIFLVMPEHDLLGSGP